MLFRNNLSSMARRGVLTLALAPLLAGTAMAQTPWPNAMIKLVVPFPAGGHRCW